MVWMIPCHLAMQLIKNMLILNLALAVNELIREIYLNTASLTNLQTDMLSHIETQRGEINLYFDGKIL